MNHHSPKCISANASSPTTTFTQNPRSPSATASASQCSSMAVNPGRCFASRSGPWECSTSVASSGSWASPGMTGSLTPRSRDTHPQLVPKLCYFILPSVGLDTLSVRMDLASPKSCSMPRGLISGEASTSDGKAISRDPWQQAVSSGDNRRPQQEMERPSEEIPGQWRRRTKPL